MLRENQLIGFGGERITPNPTPNPTPPYSTPVRSAGRVLLRPGDSAGAAGTTGPSPRRRTHPASTR